MAQGVAFGMDLYTRGKKLPVRAELEYLHRNNVSVAWSDTIAGKDNRLSGHASVDTVMLNVFCDLVSPSESPIIPFIMLSVGAALTDISTSWTEDGDILGSGRDHSTSLAGGIGGGLCFNINKYTNLDVSYRFVSLEPVTIRQSGLPGDIDMAMHDILLGLRFTF